MVRARRTRVPAARRALRLSPRDPFAALYYGIASYAQFVGRNYQETMRLARTSVRLREDHAPGHRMLTAAAAMAGSRCRKIKIMIDERAGVAHRPWRRADALSQAFNR